MKRTVLFMFGVVLVTALVGFMTPAFAFPGGDTPYPGYTGDPYTQDPTELMTQLYFGNEWVNYIPKGPRKVLSPFQHHGYISGSPLKLTPYEGGKGTFSYFEQLAKNSPRAKFWTIGQTTEGLDMYIIAISSDDTIARLDEYGRNLHRLGDPRKLGYPGNIEVADKVAEKLISDRSKTKPIFWIWGCLHSDEMGSREMLMELAYRLCVDESPMIKHIRDNMILMITDPNPDGTEMVSNWVNFYLNSGTGLQPGSPFYNWYIQHDDNRDAIVNSIPEGTNITKAYVEWPAQAILDIHQSRFLLFTFNGLEPTIPSIDSITQTEWQWYASAEMTQAEHFDMPGVWTYNYVNMYYPFYVIQNANLRNGTGKFYEVNGRAYPTTSTSNVGSSSRVWYWYQPKPYIYDHIVWSLRDNNNYSQTCSLTTCLSFADNPEKILANYYKKSKNAVSYPGTTIEGSTGEITFPYGYVVPVPQKDMPELIKMINNMFDNGIEMGVAQTNVTVGGKLYPKGSYFIKMNQPYAPLVWTLFNPLTWPPASPAPYDSTAWQYDLLRDVQVDRIDDPAILDVPTTLIRREVPLASAADVSLPTSTGAYVIDNNSINNLITFFFALGKQNYTMYMADATSGVIDPGDLVIYGDQSGVYQAVKPLVRELGLTMYSVDKGTADGVSKHQLHAPRVALYHDWNSVQEGSWSRLQLDTFQIPYTVIQHDEVAAGNLKDKYDVIILPDASGSTIYRGITPSPTQYDVVWYGPVTTLHRTGELGDAGMQAFKAFVQAGGLLICNNSSTDLPINYPAGSPMITGVTRQAAGSGSTTFYASGCIDRMNFNLSNPIVYGGSAQLAMYNDQSAVFPTTGGAEVIASFPSDPAQIFLSGWLERPENMAGKATIVRAQADGGTGHVLLFGCDIAYREQALGSFFLLFNAIMNWDL
jgi:hypothetical protein